MKVKKIITWIITIVTLVIVIMSGIMKLMHVDQIITKMEAVGVSKYILPLGLMEIIFSLLFIYPKTLRIGFLLLSCYFAGALAVELSHGTPQTALLPMILLWISAFLRDKGIFVTSHKTE